MHYQPRCVTLLMSKSPATIQVHGMGPFAITYVNPTDDPRTIKTN